MMRDHNHYKDLKPNGNGSAIHLFFFGLMSSVAKSILGTMVAQRQDQLFIKTWELQIG